MRTSWPPGPGAPAEFVIDGEDAEPGYWEVDALGSPVGPGIVTMSIESAPVRIGLGRNPKGVDLSLENLTAVRHHGTGRRRPDRR